jgi:hypothetical protein
MLDNSFFYNTVYFFKDEVCSPSSKYKKRAYKVYDDNIIYNCDSKADTTSNFIIMNKNHKIINEISFINTNKAFNYWFIGYDNDYLIAFRTIDIESRVTELISVNLKSNELTSITNLPKRNYGISEHPISENDILVFSSKGWAYIFDIKNKTLISKIFEYNSIYSPVVSKDGKLITYLSHKKVYVYNIKTGKKEMMYDLNNLNNFYAYRVYFKNNEELIVKGNKNSGSYLLENSEFLVINDKRIIERGQLDIENGYKYY